MKPQKHSSENKSGKPQGKTPDKDSNNTINECPRWVFGSMRCCSIGHSSQVGWSDVHVLASHPILRSCPTVCFQQLSPMCWLIYQSFLVKAVISHHFPQFCLLISCPPPCLCYVPWVFIRCSLAYHHGTGGITKMGFHKDIYGFFRELHPVLIESPHELVCEIPTSTLANQVGKHQLSYSAIVINRPWNPHENPLKKNH